MALLAIQRKMIGPPPKPTTIINYEQLAALVGDPRADTFRQSAITPRDAKPIDTKKAVDHRAFMRDYRNIFITESEQREEHLRRKIDKFHRTSRRALAELPNILPSSRSDRSKKQGDKSVVIVEAKSESEELLDVGTQSGATVPPPGKGSNKDECMVHDQMKREQEELLLRDHRIADHVTRIRPPRINRPGKLLMKLPRKQCTRLEKLLWRMPYERSYDDSIRVLNILQNYQPLARQVPIFQLKELVITATIERYDDVGVVVFAGSGFHIILQGSVKPLGANYVEFLDEEPVETLPPLPPPPQQQKQQSPTKSNKRESSFDRQQLPSVAEYDSGNNNNNNGPVTLLGELLNQESLSSGLSSANPRMPTMLGESNRDETTGTSLTNFDSRQDSASKRVLFAGGSALEQASNGRQTTLINGDDKRQQLQNTDDNNNVTLLSVLNKPFSANGQPQLTTADTSDTFDQMELIRLATMEGSHVTQSLNDKQAAATITLTQGDCFGTLRSRTGDGESQHDGVTLCRINEPKTLLLKLSTTSYDRINKALSQRQIDKKVNLVSTCPGYRYWSRLSLEHLAKCCVWSQFPPGTVLASEGEVCPYAGYLLSGECRMARRIFVKEKLRNGEEVNRRKEVIVGSFLPGNSFGERGLFENHPMPFTLITVTNCELSVVSEEAIEELDASVKQLLAQIDVSGPGLAAATFAEDDIYQEYIKQESDRRWSEYRRKLVASVINYQGIMPGYGRWSKS